MEDAEKRDAEIFLHRTRPSYILRLFVERLFYHQPQFSVAYRLGVVSVEAYGRMTSQEVLRKCWFNERGAVPLLNVYKQSYLSEENKEITLQLGSLVKVNDLKEINSLRVVEIQQDSNVLGNRFIVMGFVEVDFNFRYGFGYKKRKGRSGPQRKVMAVLSEAFNWRNDTHEWTRNQKEQVLLYPIEVLSPVPYQS